MTYAPSGKSLSILDLINLTGTVSSWNGCLNNRLFFQSIFHYAYPPLQVSRQVAPLAEGDSTPPAGDCGDSVQTWCQHGCGRQRGQLSLVAGVGDWPGGHCTYPGTLIGHHYSGLFLLKPGHSIACILVPWHHYSGYFVLRSEEHSLHPGTLLGHHYSDPFDLRSEEHIYIHSGILSWLYYSGHFLLRVEEQSIHPDTLSWHHLTGHFVLRSGHSVHSGIFWGASFQWLSCAKIRKTVCAFWYLVLASFQWLSCAKIRSAYILLPGIITVTPLREMKKFSWSCLLLLVDGKI